MENRNNELSGIKDIARDIAKVVSGIFYDLEVVVVGEDEYLFATSNKYFQAKASPAYTPYIRGVLASEDIVVVDDPGENELCRGCVNAHNCPQKLEIAVPFRIGDIWSGYLSIIAFSEEARERTLARKDENILFLRTLIDIMVRAGRLQIAEQSARMSAEKVSALLNTMDTVVFMCDSDGHIRSYNHDFAVLFGLPADAGEDIYLTDLLGENNPLQDAVRNGTAFSNRDVSLLSSGRMIRMIANFKPLTVDDGNSDSSVTEYLFVLRSLDAVRELIAPANSVNFEDENMIGSSPEMTAVKDNIAQFAQSTSTVLIRGETGTGKELVARSLHRLGPRKNQPFVAINCAAIPDSLLESELFGYEQGTFTGAVKGGKPGLFELGNGGTIFLDEIGDMPLHLQAKLLRVLQERQVVRLGGFHPTELDIRVVAATNQNLEDLVEQNKFRADLFYRLNILPVNLPPLRRHMSDFDDLVFHFISVFSEKLGRNITGINNNFMSKLRSYSWPGNIRELENAIEYAVNITREPVLTMAACPPDIASAIGEQPERPVALKEMLAIEEARIIKDILSEYGSEKQGVTLAAAALGISRASLYSKIKEHGIRTK